MEQLEKYEHISIPSSTLNYNLRILEDNGFIERTKRHIRDKTSGQIVFRPSMYRITSKLRKYFSNIAAKFKRMKWTPTFKQLANGFTAVLGDCITREATFHEYRQQKFDRDRVKT